MKHSESTAEDSDIDPEIVDSPMSTEEIKILYQHNPSFRQTKGVNPLHADWTDDEVLLLSSLWDTFHPLSLVELEDRLKNHSVRVARPDGKYYRDAIHAYSRYCRRRFLQERNEEWLHACKLYIQTYGFLDIQNRLDADNLIH